MRPVEASLTPESANGLESAEQFHSLIENAHSMAEWVRFDKVLVARRSKEVSVEGVRSPESTALYLNEDLKMKFGVSPEDWRFPTDISFEPQLNLAIGAADSAHGVFFGVLNFTPIDEDVYDGDEGGLAVAVKEYESRPKKVYNEYYYLNLLYERGFNTLRPLALVRGPNSNYLITMYDPSYATLDNFRWALYSGTEEYESEAAPRLEKVAAGLAELHAEGIFHGDCQVKNLGITENGEFRVVDLERAFHVELDELQTSSGVEKFVEGAFHDLEQFCKSLNRKDFLRNSTSPIYSSEMMGRIVSPYLENLLAYLYDKSGDEKAVDIVVRLEEKLREFIGVMSITRHSIPGTN